MAATANHISKPLGVRERVKRAECKMHYLFLSRTVWGMVKCSALYKNRVPFGTHPRYAIRSWPEEYNKE